MEEPVVTGSVEEYDVILRHLLLAAMNMAGKSVAGGQQFTDKQGRGLGYFPPMIALGQAAVDVMVYRKKLGKDGPDFEELAEKRAALAMLDLLGTTVGGWEPSELAEGGTD